MYRSARFVDIVSANVGRLPGDVEILVSDRTGGDDAVARLRERHGDDPRVRFLEATDDPGWVEHCNALLEQATGEFFVWMPHDDDFPADYVPLLAAALDAHPDALLAFGHLDYIHLDGTPAPSPVPALPITLGQRSRVDETMSLVRHWNLGVLFRGLMRRDEILRHRLTIRHTPGDVRADTLWGLAVVATGPIVFEPACRCRKRIYPGSTSSAWRPSLTADLQVMPIVTRYLRGAKRPTGEILRLVGRLGVHGARRFLRPSRWRSRRPRTVAT